MNNQLSIVTGPDRPDLLHHETLADIFRNAVSLYGDNTALIFGNTSLTYTELDKRSNAVAAFLQEKGIGRGAKIGVWWPRGIELHAVILGIIKVGAAYVPLDREMPAERVELVMQEVNADACFSQQQLNVHCPVFEIPEGFSDTEITSGPRPENYAYILYTSGSTGKPKGIPINHAQICHLVRAEQSLFEIRPDDKVYQGFSVSFDMWCEETWVSYFAGASLWVADVTTAKAIDELDIVLRNNKISILHAVPSLLAVMEDNIPSIRLINAGGEACTPQVVAKWSTPERIFFNSYGPTETTVSATMTTLKPGDPITIGQPLPNYNLAVVDEQLNPVVTGERGELVISGPGVSDGYINLPQLTAEKFVNKPARLDMLPGNRIYRTGDAAVIQADGSIDFQGRIDDQIKLRGYRIELGEIETRLHQLPNVSAAAVAVKKDSNDQDQLVGYIVPEDAIAFNEGELRIELAKFLPPYMVPGTIMPLEEMPRMPSGKINRKALPVPPSFAFTAAGPEIPMDMNAPVPDRVLAILHKIFPGREINLSMDFFNDLGGHSLLAAAFVSKLRRDAGIPQASLKDVYLHRPLQTLADTWNATAAAAPKEKKTFYKIPQLRYLLCWLAQTVSLLFFYGLFAVQIFVPYLGYYYVAEGTGEYGRAIITSLAMFCLIPPLFSAMSIAIKWLVIGRMKEGDYPLWGTYYFRWWFVKTMQRLLPSQFLNGTPLFPTYLKLLGMKVAPDAQLSAITIGAEDLVTIGSDASLSSQVVINNAFVEDGMLKLRRVHIGDHAYIGSSAIVAGGSRIEEWGELQDLSYLQAGKSIAPGEIWKGSPATLKQKKSIEELPQPIPVSDTKRKTYSLIFTLSLLIFPFAILLPLLPTILIIHQLDEAAPAYNFNYFMVMPSLALAYILVFAFTTIVLTRWLQKGIKPGKYPIYSFFYLRKWFADQLISLALIVLHPIYATVYVGYFFRALGAKIGKHTEISTASSVTHPLLAIGDDAFVADAVTLGETDVRGQQLILDQTTIHNNSFVGNSALIPQGYELPGNMLIGVLSTPPDEQQLTESTAHDWFGSPAIALPRRQQSNPFPEELTSRPSPQRKLARAIVEFIRIILPETAVLCFSILFIAYAHDLVTQKPLWQIILQFPLYYLCIMGLPAFGVTLLLKWIFIGRFKAQQKPMWTWKVWRSEAITSTYEALSVPFLLEYMKGTPWLPWALRLLGVKVGKRVWMNTTDITEYDMVSIGDDSALNDDCGPQTHLFEDRVMKVGPVKIGERVSIGARSIILYDSEIGNDNHLEALSLVMKGENLAPGTDWTGSPVQPA
ncbi:Pls/PosA family non-ribosomal peptide synthetase [Chitinophagaceae bacterium MMS25-I14]